MVNKNKYLKKNRCQLLTPIGPKMFMWLMWVKFSPRQHDPKRTRLSPKHVFKCKGVVPRVSLDCFERTKNTRL